VSEFKNGDMVMCGAGTGHTLDGPYMYIGERLDGLFVVEDKGGLRVFPHIEVEPDEPKLVPFTKETFPKCSVWVREIEPSDGSECLVSSVELNSIDFGRYSVFYSTLLSHYEISIDNRHSWTTAGMEEWEI